jgi:nucleoside-diphosphate-sugar epimerase
MPQFKVRATSRSNKKAVALTDLGCDFMQGDLIDSKFVAKLVEGIDIVVHCAALSSPYGIRSDFHSANIIATENLLIAAKLVGVKKFIFISSPTIYVDLKPKFNIKETDPLPKKSVNLYAETKLKAEQFVLSHNGMGIQTLALRPRAIIGAEDTVIFPRVLNAYDQGKLKIVGRGDNICDLTCVRNVIEAIHCSMQAPSNAYGEAYNITNGEPVNFWGSLNYALESLGYQPVQKKVSKKVALTAATVTTAAQPTITSVGTLTGFYLPFPDNGLVLSSDRIKRVWARLWAQCQRDKYRRHPRSRGLDALFGPALMAEAHHCLLEKFGLWLGSQVCS